MPTFIYYSCPLPKLIGQRKYLFLVSNFTGEAYFWVDLIGAYMNTARKFMPLVESHFSVGL